MKIKIQKGFIQNLSLIVIILFFIVLISGGILLYKQNNLIKDQENESAKLSAEIESIRHENESNIQKQKDSSEILEKLVEESNSKPVEPVVIIEDKSIEKGLSTDELFKENKKFMVSVMCQTREGYSYGSGIVIGKSYYNKLLILTNYHVTEGFYSPLENQPPCIVSFQTASPYFATPTMFNSVSQETMKIEDWSFLEIEDQIEGETIDMDGNFIPSPIETPIIDQYKIFPNICDQEELIAGLEILTLGFPSIGGSSFMGAPLLSLTATEGIISSEPDNYSHYFIGSAKIDHGNSGGGAFLKTNGCLAGIPTFANVGEIESLARFINLANLKVKYKSIFDYIQR